LRARAWTQVTRATLQVPKFLRSIRKQQAKYKEMNIKVAPAKPDYVDGMKAQQEAARAEAERAAAEERAAKELKREINDLETRIQRKRVQRHAHAAACVESCWHQNALQTWRRCLHVEHSCTALPRHVLRVRRTCAEHPCLRVATLPEQLKLAVTVVHAVQESKMASTMSSQYAPSMVGGYAGGGGSGMGGYNAPTLGFAPQGGVRAAHLVTKESAAAGCCNTEACRL
jgi:hypothetical protein